VGYENKKKRGIDAGETNSVEEILECTKKIKPKSSSGDNEVPSKLVCQTMRAMAEIICYIINNSLKEGIFPYNLKLAVIKPIQGVPRQKTSFDIGKSINRRVLRIWQDTDVGIPNLTKISSRWLHFRLYRKSITTFLF